jgi:hypothetical protein
MTIVVSVNQAGGCDGLDKTYGAGNWKYIGRGNARYGGRWMEKSPLANPYRVVNGQRGSAVEKYREWLWGKICEGDREVIDALVEVSQAGAVVCHCVQPGPCHGHVVVAAAEWLMSEDGAKYR